MNTLTLIKQNYRFILLLLLIVGGFLRFYNLDWGSPFYFHPDERNIASSVSQMFFPGNLHPHFFAYGSFSLYLFYFTGLLLNLFSVCKNTFFDCSVPFEQAILISRFYAAFFSTLLIPLLYLLGKELKNREVGVLAAFLTTLSVGFIQFSHFGTVETLLAFFSTVLFYCCLRYYKTKKTFFLILSGLTLGVLCSIKISSTILVITIPLTIFSLSFKAISITHIRAVFLHLLSSITKTFFTFFFAAIVFILTNPYVFLDFNGFRDSMRYESGVVLGTIPVFYTGEFYGTTPVIYPLFHSFPFLLNPLLFSLFIPSFFLFLYLTYKKKHFIYQLLICFFLLIFLSQSVVFAKWTRYLLPTLPFIYLLLSVVFFEVCHRLKEKRLYLYYLLYLSSFLFAVSYVITAFVQEDTRTAAASWARKNVDHDPEILSEMYDMGIVPFNDTFHNIQLFNFYDLDSSSPDFTPQTLRNRLEKSAYIILPSQRVKKVRLLNEKQFPKGHAFYKDLVTGNTGFIKMYQTPCDIWCTITYLGDPIFRYEETVSVFDRPVVSIYKKI